LFVSRLITSLLKPLEIKKKKNHNYKKNKYVLEQLILVGTIVISMRKYIF